MGRVELIEGLEIGPGAPLVLFAGPCALESEEHLVELGGRIREICLGLSMPLVIKASFDKANRSALSAYRGPGMESGLRALDAAKAQLALPLLVDVHRPEQVSEVAAVADVIQVPAFLCRQTDLLVAAAESGRPVNVKKGQFLSPWEARNILDKVRGSGNERVMLTERGTSFGYNNLVVDMRSLPIMRAMDAPVLFDATHSVQLPGAQGGSTGGMREFVPHLARAATAAGIDGLYMEVHEDPVQAPCDGANMWPLNKLRFLLEQILAIHELARQDDGLSRGE